jgi:DNA-binding CsgD family transcriptional regulator
LNDAVLSDCEAPLDGFLIVRRTLGITQVHRLIKMDDAALIICETAPLWLTDQGCRKTVEPSEHRRGLLSAMLGEAGAQGAKRFRSTRWQVDLQLADQIYECAFVPERWPTVLDRLAKIADGVGGHLIASSADALCWTASARLSAGMERAAATELLRRGQRPIRLSAAQHAGFLTEHDLFTDEEIKADPIYRDFLLPFGLGWAASTAIPLPTGTTAYITIERLHDRGPVGSATIEQLDILRPHLARSALMSSRLQLERARVATETLALIGLPSLVFDRGGVVLAANRMIQDMAQHISWRAGDRILLKDRSAQLRLRQAIATLASGAPNPVQSFVVRGPDDCAPLVAHIIPIRGNARDIFVRSTGVLVLTPLGATQAPQVELVQSLFDLTPAEARVARNLAAGDTLDEIAATRRVSRTTVRTQVR